MYAQYQSVWEALTAAGADFEVQTITVRDIPIRTYKQAPGTLRDIWLASQAWAENDYLVFGEERLTYGEAHANVASVVHWLQQAGVQPGDRVAIAMRNYPEWLQAYWAILSMGAVVVGMNAWWTGAEMEYGLQDAQPKALFIDAERLARLKEVPEAAAGAALVGVRIDATQASSSGLNITPWEDLLGHTDSLPEVTIDPDQDACIFYTSGTTGRPKGAQLTHRGCVHNIWSMLFAAALQRTIAVQNGLIPEDAPSPTPASLVTTPLFHVTANNCVAHGTTLGGGKLVHMYKWDAGDALKLIEAERITGMTGVPVMAREVIAHPDFETTDTSSLLTLGGGGAQLQPDLVGKIDSSVATARPNTGYGMTETCGIITSIGGDFFVDKPDSCGPAMPCYEARVVDGAGNDVPPGEPGELCVRGAQVIKGYLNRADATADTIRDGWLHTGDVARIDADGFIYIVDRIKDMVLRGGENIYCAEVESALFKHPAIAECSVFGVPDDRLGEEVGVGIYLNPEVAAPTADELRAHCKSLIASHKAPRYVWFMDSPLPRNASGKFLKRELREQLEISDAA